jgi:hypothetical protein
MLFAHVIAHVRSDAASSLALETTSRLEKPNTPLTQWTPGMIGWSVSEMLDVPWSIANLTDHLIDPHVLLLPEFKADRTD